MKKLHSSSQRARLAALVLALAMLTATGLWAGEIHDAAAAGDLSKVRALIEADPTLLDSKDDRGHTALQMACSGGPPTWTKQVAVANFLIDRGANVNARNRNGYTPLHRASSGPRQDLDLVQRLIDKGADVSAQGPNGRTPLSSAAQSGNVDVARLLIAHGADVNAFDKYRGPVQPWDLSGTILDVAINYGPSEAMAKLLVESGARLDQKDTNDNTELHLAVLKGYVDLVRLLAARGADVNAVNGYGRTALYYAAKHGYRRTADALTAAGAKTNANLETNYRRVPQLAATLKEGEAYIWGVGFLAYAVKTKKHLLVFNPSGIDESVEAGLANGHLNPNELAGQKITVLITEPERRSRPELFELARRMPGVELVTGFAPSASGAGDSGVPPYRLAVPNESLSVGDIRVQTIPALCGGLGYLVEVDGIKVFHAGLHASSNEASQIEKYRKEIDFLKPFGPIDVAMLSVRSHAPQMEAACEPHVYLLDQLSPRAVYLKGANNPEEYPKCAEILRARNIPVAYPEGGLAEGERFHYLRNRASATLPPKTDALSLSGAYLGQPLPGETPQVFARAVVSTDDQQHGAPTFSPDGNEVFWQTNRLDREKKWHVSVMTARRVGDRWTPPEVSPYEGGPVFSPDGQRLYFDSKGEGDDPYFLEKQGDGWGEKKYVRIVSRFPELKFAYNLSIARSGTLYFLGHAGGLGLWNDYGLYRAELINGEYTKPELLPPSVNPPGALNWTPFVAPDESYLIFCSRRMTPQDDYGDLYVCFRQPDGTWTDRVSLGEPINSKVLERFPTVSPDGKYLFFTRWTPEHDEDVFWVSAGIIEQLKAKTVQEQRLKSGHRQEGPK